MSNLFICLLGIATVFLGLVCIIVLCKLMSFVCALFPEKKSKELKQAPLASGQIRNDAPIANKSEIVAAVCATIAEELGEDVKNIKVVSFKRA